jgi:hypothetical protein
MAELPAPYHVGIIVADLDVARARLTELLGVRWGPVIRLDAVEYRDADGNDIDLPTAMCYSSGDFSLELIEETPDTVWVRNPHSNLHHLGYWSERFEADSGELGDSMCPLEIAGRRGAHAPAVFTYQHDDVLGIRIELVDAATREAMAPMFEAESDG